MEKEDTISRQSVIEQIDNWSKDEFLRVTNPFDYLRKRINSLPSVTPQLKTGHWIDDEFGSRCSCCDMHTHLNKFGRPMKFRHCSMCGAKMVEPQENKDIELVIKIPEKQYQSMKNGHIPYSVLRTIMNSTPLPKGHGDLIDRDELLNTLEKLEWIRTNCSVDEDNTNILEDIIGEVPTIIEEDEENKE